MSFLFRGILVASDDPSRRVVPDRHSRRRLQDRPGGRARGKRQRRAAARDGVTEATANRRGRLLGGETERRRRRRARSRRADFSRRPRTRSERSGARRRAGLAEPGRPWRRRQAEQRAIRRWRPTCLSDACVRPFGRPRHRGHQSRPDLLEALGKRSRRVSPWQDTTARCLTRVAFPRPQGRCGCCGRRRRRR
jgi:hypothetical protein